MFSAASGMRVCVFICVKCIRMCIVRFFLRLSFEKKKKKDYIISTCSVEICTYVYTFAEMGGNGLYSKLCSAEQRKTETKHS